MGTIAATRRIGENSLCLEIYLGEYTFYSSTRLEYPSRDRQAISRLLEEPDKKILIRESTRFEDFFKDLCIHSEAKPSRWTLTSVTTVARTPLSRDVSRALSLMKLEVLNVNAWATTELCGFLSTCLPNEVGKRKELRKLEMRISDSSSLLLCQAFRKRFLQLKVVEVIFSFYPNRSDTRNIDRLYQNMLPLNGIDFD